MAGEAGTRGTDDWAWPDALDAVSAAPGHHVVLLENERVQVLEARVEAGDTVPLHTHRWAGVQCFPSLADFVRRNESGEVVVDSRAIQLPDERPLVLPTFLTSTLGAPAAALGLIEGIDDGIVGAAKVASGPLAE